MTCPDLNVAEDAERSESRHGGLGSGYSHPQYAASLAEFGQPRHLPKCGGWILERVIPGTEARDAMGCYPLFSCRNWSALPDELIRLNDGLVSLVVVTDPFAEISTELLSRAFPDLVLTFKEHFVTDLRETRSAFVSSHHRYYARKALREIVVERCTKPFQALEEWSTLYAVLASRHQLSGIKAFSRPAFAKQLQVPGLVMLQAKHEGETVGAHLWYKQGDIAYSHLTAANDIGYELMASYALSFAAIEYFADKACWLDWGAGAGLDTAATDGLTQFKRGWSNTTRSVYLCGRIFDPVRYEQLSRSRGVLGSSYFPAYRADEFR